MKMNMRKLLSLVCALCLVGAAGAAAAESLSLTGTVEAGKTITVYAPVGGTAESVTVEPGTCRMMSSWLRILQRRQERMMMVSFADSVV